MGEKIHSKIKSKALMVIDAREKEKSRNRCVCVCVWRLGKWYSLNRVVKKILTEKCWMDTVKHKE